MTAPTNPPEAPAMPMPQSRFTVRGLMVAVAVAGVGMGGVRWKRGMDSRSWHYALTALRHEQAEQLARDLMVTFAEPHRPEMADIGRREYATNRAFAAYYAALRAKYERAARSPWLPVAPDPPGPE